MIASKMVEELGLAVGEDYTIYYPEPVTQEGAVQTIFQHPVRIVGVWRAIEPEDDFWFYRQAAFDEVFLMPEASYVQMAQGMRGEVGLALWSLIEDGDNVRSTDVNSLLGRIGILRNKMTGILQNIDIARSPEEQLINYSRTVLLLTVSLYVFSVPILGIVLYFITLISGMIVQRQRNEVAMLRSRGTTTGQVVGIYVLEGLIIGALSIVLGSLMGERMAQVMGLTRSFLVLENRPFLPTSLAWSSLRFGLIALVASLLASIMARYQRFSRHSCDLQARAGAVDARSSVAARVFRFDDAGARLLWLLFARAARDDRFSGDERRVRLSVQQPLPVRSSNGAALWVVAGVHSCVSVGDESAGLGGERLQGCGARAGLAPSVAYGAALCGADAAADLDLEPGCVSRPRWP